jgi:hypothetical protein
MIFKTENVTATHGNVNRSRDDHVMVSAWLHCLPVLLLIIHNSSTLYVISSLHYHVICSHAKGVPPGCKRTLGKGAIWRPSKASRDYRS